MADWGDSFAQSFGAGLERGERKRQADREFGLRQQEHDARMALLKLQTSDAQRVHDATENLSTVARVGVPLQQNIQAQDADFEAADQAQLAGLPMPKYNEATWKAPLHRKASDREIAEAGLQVAAARGVGMGEAQDRVRGYARQERMSAFFNQYKGLSDAELLQRPELRSLFNDNPRVKGSVGYDEKTKKFVVTDYNGSGQVQYMSRAEVLDAAMQMFEESEGEYDKSVARGLTRTERNRTRNRQDVADNNSGTKTAFDMNLANEKLGIDRAQLGLSRERLEQERNQLLGLQQGYQLGPDGKLQPVTYGIRFNIKSGQSERVTLPGDPAGFVPASALATPALQKIAESLVGQPTGRPGLDGKPEVFTPETAMAAARQQVIQNYTQQPGAGGLPTNVAPPPRRGAPTPARGGAGAAPVDRIGNGPIGPLTPTSVLMESAAAGNPRAAAALEVRNSDRNAGPSTAAGYLTR